MKQPNNQKRKERCYDGKTDRGPGGQKVSRIEGKGKTLLEGTANRNPPGEGERPLAHRGGG